MGDQPVGDAAASVAGLGEGVVEDPLGAAVVISRGVVGLADDAAAVERLEGVRAGDVAAFAAAAEDGREEVVVVVQCRAATEEAQDRLRAAVAAVVRKAAGVESRVVLAPTRSLTFTTSGKLSRALARRHYLDGRFGSRPSAPVPTRPVAAG